MDSILTELKNTTDRVIKVSARMKAIREMFTHEEDTAKVTATYGGFDVDKTIECYTIFQTEDITVTWGKWTKKGREYPDHCHRDSIEYLIIFSGSFVIKIGDYSQIVTKGDCIRIPKNMHHVNLALEDNSEMFGICIPPEKAYLKEEFL